MLLSHKFLTWMSIKRQLPIEYWTCSILFANSDSNIEIQKTSFGLSFCHFPLCLPSYFHVWVLAIWIQFDMVYYLVFDVRCGLPLCWSPSWSSDTWCKFLRILLMCSCNRSRWYSTDPGSAFSLSQHSLRFFFLLETNVLHLFSEADAGFFLFRVSVVVTSRSKCWVISGVSLIVRTDFFSQPPSYLTHSSPGLRQSLDMNGILKLKL